MGFDRIFTGQINLAQNLTCTVTAVVEAVAVLLIDVSGLATRSSRPAR